MIKVPDIGSRNYHGPFSDEESFDPTRDDWSRHEKSGSKPDGVGFLDEDEEDADVPSWYEPDNDLDDHHDGPLHRAA